MTKLKTPTAARLVKQINGDWYILWRVPTNDKEKIRYRYKNGLNRIKNLDLREAWAKKIIAFIDAAAFDGRPPTQKDVETQFDFDTIKHQLPLPPLQKNNNPLTFFEFFDNYLNQRAALVAERTTRGRRTILNNFTLFSQNFFNKPSLDWTDFDVTFPVHFQNWGYQKPRKWSQNNAAKTLRVLTMILADAENQGYDVGTAYKQKNYRLAYTPFDSIALTFDEVKKLADMDLSNESVKMQRVRDIFVLDCLCGLRYSDVAALDTSNFKEMKRHTDGELIAVIEAVQKKTGERVVVPLHPISKRMLERNGGKMPQAYSNQKMNDYLKQLGKIAGLNKVVVLRSNKAGKATVTKHKQYEVMTCHTARRTFATIAFVEWKMPSALVMQATGHKSERDFLKYIKVESEQAAGRMFDYFKE